MVVHIASMSTVTEKHTRSDDGLATNTVRSAKARCGVALDLRRDAVVWGDGAGFENHDRVTCPTCRPLALAAMANETANALERWG